MKNYTVIIHDHADVFLIEHVEAEDPEQAYLAASAQADVPEYTPVAVFEGHITAIG